MEKQLEILVADDDPDDISLLKEGLLNVYPNANINVVYDGQDCIRYLKKNAASDLIFLDLNMPIKGGLQCLKDIWKEDLLPPTPIVIYSTSHNIKDIDCAFKHGASLYLVKPDSFTGLIKLLEEVADKLDHQVATIPRQAEFVVREEKNGRYF